MTLAKSAVYNKSNNYDKRIFWQMDNVEYLNFEMFFNAKEIIYIFFSYFLFGYEIYVYSNGFHDIFLNI